MKLKYTEEEWNNLSAKEQNEVMDKLVEKQKKQIENLDKLLEKSAELDKEIDSVIGDEK